MKNYFKSTMSKESPQIFTGSDLGFIRRYWRHEPIGDMLTRERLILGLQQIAFEWGYSLSLPEQQRWILACQQAFGISPDEEEFLQRVFNDLDARKTKLGIEKRDNKAKFLFPGPNLSTIQRVHSIVARIMKRIFEILGLISL